MYADDLLIVSESEEGLKNCLNKLADFCEKSLLNINLDKSKLMIFTPSGKVSPTWKFLFRNENLEIVKSYKYLGITFTSDGKFSYQATLYHSM
jgi:hypothetical protein